MIDGLTSNVLPEGEPGGHIVQALADRGWSVTEDFLSPLLVSQLAAEGRELWRTGDFRHAGIGRGDGFQVKTEVRTDWVHWLDPENCTGGQHLYLVALEALRLAINRQMLLGLFEFEGHLAVYPPGTYYRKHLDQFRGIGRRTVTCILYLNSDWTGADGGQLRIHTDPTDADHYDEILPVAGRLVTFLSARFLHEVMPARRERFSVTGWFKTREQTP